MRAITRSPEPSAATMAIAECSIQSVCSGTAHGRRVPTGRAAGADQARHARGARPRRPRCLGRTRPNAWLTPSGSSSRSAPSMLGATVNRTIAGRLASHGEELLAALLASTVDGVYAVDAQERVLFANRAALSILGYEEESDLLGRGSNATIHYRRPDGRPFPASECPLLRPRSAGEVVRVEEDWFVRRDGTFVPVAYSSAPVIVDGARGAVVVFRDITERHRAEAERRRAEAIHASRARLVEAQLEERRR